MRIDSGDLPMLVQQVRDQLDSLGATKTRITVTNDLDEYTIAALAASPVDSYGVGTSVVTGSGSPASGMVYKLVAHRDRGGDGEWVSVAKKSADKATRRRAQVPGPAHDASGTAIAEVVHIVEKGDIPDDTGRDLLVPLITDGEVDREHLGPDGTAACARAPASWRWRAAGRGAPPRPRRAGAADGLRVTAADRSQREPSYSAFRLLVDLFAGGADRELLGVAARHPHLAAERLDRLAGQRGLEDLAPSCT